MQKFGQILRCASDHIFLWKVPWSTVCKTSPKHERSTPMLNRLPGVLFAKFCALCSVITRLLMAAKEFHFNIIYPQVHKACLDVLQMSDAEFCGEDVSQAPVIFMFRMLGNCLTEAMAADWDKIRSLGLSWITWALLMMIMWSRLSNSWNLLGFHFFSRLMHFAFHSLYMLKLVFRVQYIFTPNCSH